MTDTLPFSSDALATAIAGLQELQRTERRAQLSALLPSIDVLISQGVSYEAIARNLERSEIVLKPSSIRQALYRWRKRQRSLPAIEPRAAVPALPTPGPQQSSSPAPTPSPAAAPNIVRNKADLVRLRMSKEPIDLNALAELGRQK